MTVSTGAPIASTLSTSTLSNPSRVTLRGSTLGAALDELERLLDGELVRPADLGWDDARAAWQLGMDQRPLAVVVARSEADVARTLRLASRMGIRVAPQGTGHGAVALDSLADAILLRTGALDHVAIDVVGRTATIGAGVTWGTVADAAAPYGLAGLAGSSRSVGVVGYCLGGGLGWLGRLHGLGAHTIVSARVALPGGAVVIASAAEHADLWWALRGGGGAGVVTELTIRLVELPDVQAGSLWWPVERASDVLKAWARLLPSLPSVITTVARVLHLPDLEMVPPHLRGKSFVLIQAVIAGTADLSDRLLAPLRALHPAMDDVTSTSPGMLGHLAMDPPDPTAGAAEGVLLRELTDATIDGWLATLGTDACRAVVAAEIRQLGGALRPHEGTDAALPGLEAVAAAVAVAPCTPDVTVGDAGAAVAAAVAGLDSWAAPLGYSNFVERPSDERRLVGTAIDRLATVRLSYDPDAIVMRRHGGSR